MHRLSLIATAILAFAMGPVFAADTVSGNAASGYGRLLFQLTPQDQVNAQTTGTVLTVTFNRKVGVTPDAIMQALPQYIASGRADADGKTYRFVLSQPVRLHTSTMGGKFAVDLAPQSFTGTPPELPKPPPPAPTAVDISKLPVLKVRSGAYHNFTRLVFDWPREVPYTVFPGSGKLTVRFEAQANPDFSAIDRQMPPWVKAAGWHIADRGMVVDLSIDMASGYHDFRDGTHVVVDVLAPKTDADKYNPPGDAKPSITALTTPPNPAKAAATQPAAAAKPATVPTPAKVATAQPAPPAKSTTPPAAATGAPAKLGQPTPPGKAAASAPNTAQAAPPTTPPPATPANTATPTSEGTPVTAGPAAASETPVDPKDVQAADGKLTHDGAVLLFPGAGQRGAAVFVRGLNAWIVLQDAPPLDVAKLKTQLGSFPVAVEATSGEGTTRLRITLHEPKQIAAYGEGSTLKVVISSQVTPTAVSLGFARNQEDATHSTISTLVPGARRVERLIDPLAGDEIMVVPTLPGRYVPTQRDFIEFSALPSAAGLVLMPYVDDLAVNISNTTRLTITRPGGLSLTPPSMPSASTPEGLAANGVGPCFLDYAKWKKISGGNFLVTERRLRVASARLAPAAAFRARLTLAQFYLANGYSAEALGLINLMQSSDPGLQSDMQLQTMRAAASLGMYRPRDAHNALASAQFDTDRHAALWRGLTEAESENWEAAFVNLQRAAPVLKAYDQELQIRAHLAGAEAGLGSGRLEVADEELDKLPKKIEGKLGVHAALTRARLYAAEHRRGRANRLFAQVEKSGDEQLEAESVYYRITAELSSGNITPDQAANALERLRFRWRGDLLELKTLRKLASIYFDQKRWRDGLGILRVATANFPNEEWTMQAQDDMRGAFVRLFLKGQADTMDPVKALALFYDFIELTPIGVDGDEMIRRMADRLVKIDLLGPAADLLNYQITKRLDGVARAQVATRLALIQLMDHKPQAVLDTLRSTTISTIPDDVAHQRLLIEARALTEQKRYDHALDLIGVDQAPDTQRLRADIYWRSANWPLAAQTAEQALGERWNDATPLTDAERQDVMRAAVAYSLANDETSLDRLRAHFTPKMKASRDGSAFAVVSERIDLQGVAFRDAAAKVATVDSLKSFMQDFQKR